MSSTTGGTLVFPSVEWFQAVQQIVNDDPEFRRIGTIDVSAGIKVGTKVFILTFEAFRCTQVRQASEVDLLEVEFYLEMSAEDWAEMLQNIKENNGADLNHSLNTLDMMKESGISKNAIEDQYLADMFFRYNQSLQHFFDVSARLDTTFES